MAPSPSTLSGAAGPREAGGGGCSGGDAWHPPRSSFLSHMHMVRSTRNVTLLAGPREAGVFHAHVPRSPPALARLGRCFCAKFSTNKAPRRRRVATPIPPFQARTTGIFPLSRVINERRRPGPPSVGGGGGGNGRQNPSTTTTTTQLPPPPPARRYYTGLPEDIPT